MQAHGLDGGFPDPPIDASFAFRAVMNAMARPGQIVTIEGARPPAPLSVAAGAVLLTLCDPETPVFLGQRHNTAAVRAWITFHTGAPFVAADQAMFALGDWLDLPRDRFSVGTAQYPDRSATLIVESTDLSNAGSVLSGPGIADQVHFALPETAAFQANARLFPLGLDFIFTSGGRLAALPRTTRVS